MTTGLRKNGRARALEEKDAGEKDARGKSEHAKIVHEKTEHAKIVHENAERKKIVYERAERAKSKPDQRREPRRPAHGTVQIHRPSAPLVDITGRLVDISASGFPRFAHTARRSRRAKP